MKTYFNSTIFKKTLASLSGAFLVLFLVGHLVGNLQLFISGEEGQKQFNQYALFMTTNPVVNILSLITYSSIILHILLTFYLTIQSRTARPIRYAVSSGITNSSWASNNMAILGTLLLIFLVIHLRSFWFEMHFGSIKLDSWGNPYLETVIAISNDDGVEIFSQNFEAEYEISHGLNLVDISADGKNTIFVVQDWLSTDTLVSVIDSEEEIIVNTKTFNIPSGGEHVPYAISQIEISSTGKYTFVGTTNNKVMVMLETKSLIPISTLVPYSDQHDPENVEDTYFNDIQSSSDGNFIFTKGRFFYRHGNSASDVETVHFMQGFFTGRSDADNDGVEDVYDDCPDTEEYPVLDGLSLEGCS